MKRKATSKLFLVFLLLSFLFIFIKFDARKIGAVGDVSNVADECYRNYTQTNPFTNGTQYNFNLYVKHFNSSIIEENSRMMIADFDYEYTNISHTYVLAWYLYTDGWGDFYLAAETFNEANYYPIDWGSWCRLNTTFYYNDVSLETWPEIYVNDTQMVWYGSLEFPHYENFSTKYVALGEFNGKRGNDRIPIGISNFAYEFFIDDIYVSDGTHTFSDHMEGSFDWTIEYGDAYFTSSYAYTPVHSLTFPSTYQYRYHYFSSNPEVNAQVSLNGSMIITPTTIAQNSSSESFGLVAQLWSSNPSYKYYTFNHWLVNSTITYYTRTINLTLGGNTTFQIFYVYTPPFQVSFTDNPEINAEVSVNGSISTTPFNVNTNSSLAGYDLELEAGWTSHSASYAGYLFDYWLVNSTITYYTRSLSLLITGNTTCTIFYTYSPSSFSSGIINGGFELGISTPYNWTYPLSPPNHRWATDQAHGGSKSIAHNNTDGFQGPIDYPIQTLGNISSNAVANEFVWLKCTYWSTSIDITLHYNDSSSSTGTIGAETGNPSIPLPWTQCSFHAVVTPNKYIQSIQLTDGIVTETNTIWIDDISLDYFNESEPTNLLSVNAYANPGTGNVSIPVQTIIDGYYYTTPASVNHTYGNFTVEMASSYSYNATHDVYFSEWTDGTLGNSRTVNFTGALALGANYGFIRHADFGGYFNFFLGVFGLILMGGGVIALKICWDDHNIVWGLGICLACEIIGLGFCTILVGG